MRCESRWGLCQLWSWAFGWKEMGMGSEGLAGPWGPHPEPTEVPGDVQSRAVGVRGFGEMCPSQEGSPWTGQEGFGSTLQPQPLG